MRILNNIVQGHSQLAFLDLEGTQFTHEMIAIGIVKVDIRKDGTIKKIHKGYHSYVYAKNKIGKIVTDFPASIPELNRAKPVLQKFKGWKTSLRPCGSYEKLPAAAKEYVEFIEDFTGTSVVIVSVGPDRNETYNRIDPWKK